MIEIEKRITKYRIWDEELKKMDYDGGSLSDIIDTNIHDCKYLYLNRLISDISDRFCSMSFTGAHDNQSKEIYEGDLVKWREQINIDDYVKTNEYIFGLVLWDREECRFVVSQITKGKWTYKVGDNTFEHDTQFYSYGGAEFNWGELEVVGNIYEDPDLYNNLKEESRNVRTYI